MKKISKLHRLMAVLLALVMVIGTLPVTALAEGTENSEAEHTAQVPQTQEQGSGETEKEAEPTAQIPQAQEQGNGETEKETEPTAQNPQPQEQGNGETEKENETDSAGTDSENESVQDKAAAEAVIKKIAEIGEVKAESGNLIAEARKAYDSLNEETKLLVTNADQLVAAETALAALKAQQEESTEASGYKFGSAEKELAPGRYLINIRLMNASDIGSESMAKSCIKGGDVTVADNGEAWVTLYLNPVSLGALSDWSSQWQIYNEYNTSSASTNAEVVSKDSEGHETAIRFKVPDNSWDGVYCSMFVSIMGIRPDAYLSLDYASATPGAFNPGPSENDGDKQAAQSVIDLINAIGEEVSLESQDAVKAARDAYDKLTEAQRGYVTNIDVLTNAENTIKDMLAAKAVDDKIAAIGTVGADSGAAISEARSAFESLNDTQKTYVKNLSVLTEAEKAFEEVKYDRYRFGSDKILIMPGTHEIGVQLKKESNPSKDSMAADCVKGGSIEVTESGEAFITIKLGPKKMGFITGWATNWEIYNEYNATSATTPAEVTETDSDGNVTAIRFKLPDNSWDGVYCKMNVTAAPVKPKAILKIDYTGASTPVPDPDQQESDAAAAKLVSEKISAIGDVTLDSEAAIKEARSEYEKLTPAQKELVKNIDVLEAAEAKLEELQNQSKYEFGSAKTVLKPGTYNLPITMMNSGNITSPSMAGDTVKGGSIEVTESGEAFINVKLGAKDMGGMIGWATDWKIYNEYKVGGESTPAEIVSKDSNDNVTEIRFALPDNSWDGVYCNLVVMVEGMGQLMNPDAYLKLDFANAGSTPDPDPDADAAAAKLVSDKISAIGEVTLDSEAAIKEARSEYEKLTPAQKELVKNIDVLEAAEVRLEELQNQSKYEFGSAKTVLKPGKYNLPITMMNSGNITSPSMAGDTVKGGSIEVTESGEAFINVKLGAKDMGGMIGWATDWKIYNEYKVGGESTPAEIVSKDSNDNVTEIRFKLSDNSWDGVYCNLVVMVEGMGQLMNPDAYLKLDFANAGSTPDPDPDADAAAAKLVSEKISAIGDVTLDSEAAIKEARSEYEKLTPAQKELVKNIDVLEAAEARLEELQNQSKYEFGSAKTVLKPGKYNLPITMMNSGNITSPSMAGDTVKGGSIEVTESGEAFINVKLGAKDMGGMIGWATDWKIYNEYKVGGESTPAEIVSKDSNDNVTEIRFKLSDNSWDGVYCNLVVMVEGMGQLMNPDAYLKLDFANAGSTPDPDPDADAVAAKLVSDKISAIGEVTLDSEAAIKEARSEYEKLTPAQKELVKNIDVLEAAEARLEELQNQSKYEFGSAKTVLKPGKYNLPITMMNSGNITSPSMAGDTVKGGSIEVTESGEAFINVKLGAKDMGGMIGWATDWKIYNEYKVGGESTPAEIVSKDSNDNVIEIRFALPDNSWDGVYCNLVVMVEGMGQLMNPDAYLKLDFANAGNEPEIKSYPVNFSAGSNGGITASVDGKEIKTGDMVESGKKVSFTATPDEGFEVESWEGVKATGNSATAVVEGELNVKVNFKESETKVYNGFSKGKNYDTYAKVSVKDEVITDVELTHDAAEKYPDSLSYAEKAKAGMQDKFIGKSSTDKAAIESIDAVTGATATSDGFKKAVMNALGLDKTTEFAFGSAQTKFAPGVYTVPISLKNATSHDTASVAGGAFAPEAKLTVKEDGSAVLTAYMQNVSMGPIKDMAYNVNYYKEDNCTSQDYPVDIIESMISPEGMVSAGKEVPTVISFTIPDNSFDGVYMNFTVDAMGGASPDAWLKINYAGWKEPDGDGKTFKGSAKVNQFGKYTIDAEVSVENGLITDVKVSARDFESTTHIDTNKAKIQQVTKGLKNAWNGIAPTEENAESVFKAIMKKDKPEEVLDAVSGATYSARAVRDAVMDAFKLEYQDEIINVPVEVKPGVYQVDISYYSDVVLHSLVENQKTTATLTVNADKSMSLDFDLKSGTKKEPLYILGFNGVHTDNDRSKALTMDGCSTVMGLSSNDYSDKYFEKGTKVVNHVTFPLLGGLTDIYNTNCYLYVPVMNNLDGDLSGVHFDHGKFNVDVFAKVFWDSMKKIDDVPMPEPPENDNDIHNLADGSYIINGTVFKTDKATVSMADQGISHQILLTVSGGSYTLTLDFGSINFAGQKGYLGNLSYYLSGYAVGGGGKPVGAKAPGWVQSYQTYTDGTRVEDEFGTDYPDRVSFEMIPEAKNDGYVPLQVFVPIMDSITPGTGYQDVYLKLDLASIRPGNPGGSSNDNVLPQDAIDVTDKDTGIRVKADKGVFEEKVKLVIREILSGKQHDDAAEILKEVGTAFKLYDVSFENEKGEKVQPKGKVTVYYPIPDDFNEKEMGLYNIKDDGTKSLVKGSVKDGYYVAVQKHFSTYALVDTSTLAKDKAEDKPESVVTSPTTADGGEKTGSSTVWIWVVVSIVAVAAVVTFVVVKTKKQQKVK